MTRTRLILVGLVVVALVAGVLAPSVGRDEGEDAPEVVTSTATPEVSATATASATPTALPQSDAMREVYTKLGASLGRAGLVTIVRGDAPEQIAPTTFWALGEVARREASASVAAPTQVYVSVAVADGVYTLDPTGSFSIDRRACPGATAAAALLLDCPDREFETWVFPQGSGGSPQARRERPVITVEGAQLGGEAVVLLTTVKRQQPFRSNPIVETRRIYLDAATYLPRRIEVRQESPGSPGVQETATTYTVQTVSSAEFDRAYFEPSNLLVRRPLPEGELRQASNPVYWLGATPTGLRGVPDLRLWQSSRYRPDGGSNDTEQVMLEYVAAGDTFGQALLLRLTEYTRAQWERAGSSTHAPPDPCWTSETVMLATVPSGSAVVYSGYSFEGVPPANASQCPSVRSRDRFFAVASIGESRVVVEPMQWPGQSREGLVSLAQALVLLPRQVGTR